MLENKTLASVHVPSRPAEKPMMFAAMSAVMQNTLPHARKWRYLEHHCSGTV